MNFIRKKVHWEKQDVYDYGGDGEYAGSFDKPDFINIQAAKGSQCVVAKQRKTGHWYWFRENDTLLPWNELLNEGACEVSDPPDETTFLDSEFEGPFATEKAAKRFGENYVRREWFDEEQSKKREKHYEKARKFLRDLLREEE